MTTVEIAAPFDVCGPLPTGTTVLEASAGTGKTFTIAALATRYVAEGIAELSDLMLVTFSRAATQELRERVRERLVSAEHGLADPGGARAGSDELLRLLATGTDDAVALRRHRLSRALAGFDAATIATTHGFCQQMLAGLGMLGDREEDTTFVEQVDDLVKEVVDDLYVRKFAREPGDPEINYLCARKVARDAMADRQAELVPVDAPKGSAAQLRYGMASKVREEVERRKRIRRLIDYDDLLTRLRDALTDPVRGAAACERLRSRYQVVLVDEFQDTDPVQWQVLDRAFSGVATLVLIGDPKQAIYAFRGADVYSYLDAVQQADRVCTLGTNRRSDEVLVEALDTLLGGAALGDEQIVVRPVRAHHRGSRLMVTPVSGTDPLAAPVRLRIWPHAPDAERVPSVATIRPRILADLVADVTALLASDLRLDLGAGPRPVAPADIAVLVRKNERGEAVRDGLVAAGVPAVMHGASSVFA
ncbi:MAG: UvrD-helicase domain-containing protein, partial [Actinomycetota bacterium]|nr:UvrD-helicase domain-containing protein [Actinomycetota bacterium]